MPSVTVIGLDDVRQALKDAPAATRAVLRDVVRDSVRIIAQRTQQAAPIDTGATRQAIVGVPPKGSGLTGSVRLLPGTFKGRVPASYVLALEYGKGVGARPFIRTTAEREAGPFVARMQKAGPAIARATEHIGGRNL